MSKLKIIVVFYIFTVMLVNPQLVFNSTMFAVDTWWNNVLPALLPFFIVSEFMIRLGIPKCLSIWLEPVMQPLFKLSGASALAVVMGFVSGTPTAAGIVSVLYNEKLCTKNEAERLLAFTNNSGPLYILSAVATGIFQNPSVGIILFLSHYPINFIIGIILGVVYGKNTPTHKHDKNFLIIGLNILNCYKIPSIGKMLNDILKKSLSNICLVGGFMVVFGILTATFDATGITNLICKLFTPICLATGINTSCAWAMATGFWEMTIGIAILPNSNADMLSMLMSASMILAWNGISVHSQIAAMVADTDLSLKKYRICRLIHSVAAPFAVMLMYKKAVSVFAYGYPDTVFFFNNLTTTALLLFGIVCLFLLGLLGKIIK